MSVLIDQRGEKVGHAVCWEYGIALLWTEQGMIFGVPGPTSGIDRVTYWRPV